LKIGPIPSPTEPKEMCVWGNVRQAARLHHVSKWNRGRPCQGQSYNGHATTQDSNSAEFPIGQAAGHPQIHITASRQVPTFQPSPA